MIQKDKLFVVASNIDDSIKSTTPMYEISIFPNFLMFEDYVNSTPLRLGGIVISERELPFTSQNVSKLLDVITAPFLKLTGSCIYLISNETDKEMVQSFFEENDIKTIVCYQGDLSVRFITDIISGAARIADESETEIITYRMRATEYAITQNIKKYESDEEHYVTDEEELADVPTIREPELFIPSIDVLTNSYYVVGMPSFERTLFVFLQAQYLSLLGKTVIIESDIEYHRLTDMAKHSTVSFELIDISEFLFNCSEVIGRIKNSANRLIILGCTERVVYDYEFVYEILYSNLLGSVDYFIKECDFDQTPYGSFYTIVCTDMVPDIIKCVNSLKYDIDPNKVVFIGMRTRDFGAVNVSSSEMTDIVRLLLQKDGLHAEVLTVKGINLKGDGVVYDVFSIIGRGNERQG